MVSHDYAASLNFPIEWTSTQLEGAVPGLCNVIGYDVKLNTRWMNNGAPRFIFNKDEMKIKFDMIVEVYNEEYNQMFMEIHYNGMEIDFGMKLSDTKLMVNWQNITLDSAEIITFV